MTKSSPTSSLLLAGQFPPPVTGFAFITQEIARALAARYDVTTLDLSAHRARGGVAYHLKRLGLALSTALKILRAPPAPLYIACDGGFGLVYTLILACAARLSRRRIFLHHHSFHYIDARKPLMAALLRVMGPGATHIFLCPGMAARFAARYGRPVRALILSNSAFVDPAPALARALSPDRPLVLGLLSNLNEEKGLSLFLETLRRAADSGLPVRGALAGPADGADLAKIAAAQTALQGRLDYRGPLYGAAKAAFYEEIDVFVFPTRYANEAQPTVIFEAMAFGAPTLSFDRGCIKGQVGSAGAVFNQKQDFAAASLAWLTRNCKDLQAFSQLKLDTQQAFLNDRAKARRTLEALLTEQPEIFDPTKAS